MVFERTQKNSGDHYPKVADYLENNNVFRDMVIKINTAQNKIVEKVFGSIHNAAFPETKNQTGKIVNKLENKNGSKTRK